MRKVISVLLAVMLAVIPCLSIAEAPAQRVTLNWEADQTGVALWLQAAGLDAQQADELAPAVTDLMNTLSLSSTANNDGSAAHIGLSLSDWEAFGMDMSITDGMVYYFYSFLPSYAVALDLMGLDPMGMQAMQEEAIENCIAAVIHWAGQLPMIEETGTFAAEAYSCASRSVVTITDSQLAELMGSLLGVLGGEEAASAFGEAMMVSSGNESGLIRVIFGYDEERTPVGFSVTLGTETDTILTISVGINDAEESLHLIAGWGFTDSTCYLDANLAFRDDGEQLILDAELKQLKGAAPCRRVLRDGDKVFTLNTVFSHEGEHALTADSTLTLANGAMLGEKDTFVSDGTQLTQWLVEVTSGADRMPAWSFCVLTQDADAIVLPDLSQRTVISMDDMISNTAILTDISSQMEALSLQLMSHIPSSVLMLIINLFQ